MLAALLTGCSTGEQTPVVPGGDQTQQTNPPKTELAQTLVYDSNGIKITATELKMNGFMGPEIKFLVENNTDKNIAFTADLLVVDGVTVTGYMYVDVAAGKKANDVLTVYETALESAGIDTIGRIVNFDGRIVDTDSFETLYDAPFTLETSAAGTVTPGTHDSGELLFQDQGISVYTQVIADQLFGKSVRLLVKNETQADVIVQAENISVNGFTVDAWMYDTVYANTVRYCELDLLSSSLADNGIETIEAVTFTLEILNANTYDIITQSQELTVTAAQ